MNNKTNLKSDLYVLHNSLKRTDHQALKYAEGELTEEEFAPIRAQRKAWRLEINQLEDELESLKNQQQGELND